MEQYKKLESPSGAWITVDGKPVLSFGGCCYLGLAKVPELIDAGTKALKEFGMTAQMSRYYGFLREPNRQVEDEAKKFFGTEDAMYFSTGYLFGTIALSGIADQYDVIFLDEKAHYSLSDAAFSLKKQVITFKHMNSNDLENKIRSNLHTGEIPLVATDGMFPTFGSIPPLKEYQEILKKHNGWMVVDESHSFGSVGMTGCGASELNGLEREKVIAGGSLGKAFCAFGGIAIGSKNVIAAMRTANAARGSAAGTAANAAIAAASFAYVRKHPEMLEKLRVNTQRLKQGLCELGIRTEKNESPVSTFTIGNAATMKQLQRELWEKSIFVGYTTYVGAGPEGAIRCAVFSDHEFEDIDRLLDELRRIKRI